MSNIYLPTAHIAAAGYSVAGAARRRRRNRPPSSLATLLPAVEATRVAPSPAMRAGSVEAVRRRGSASARAAAGRCRRSRPPRRCVALRPSTASRSSASPPSASSWPRSRSPRRCSSGRVAARSAAPLRALFGAPGPLGARFFGGALARNGIAVTALAMALGMTLAMIVTVASIRETVRVWVESTLRSDLWVKAAAGKRSGLVGDLPEDVIAVPGAVPGRRGGRSVPRARRGPRDGRPFTLASGDFRVVARIGGLPFLDGQRRPRDGRRARAGTARSSSPSPSRGASASRAGDPVDAPDAARARGRFPVAGVYRDYSNDRGTVVLDRALYLSLFADRRVTSVAVVAAPGVDAADAPAPDPARGARGASPSRSRRTASCAARCSGSSTGRSP